MKKILSIFMALVIAVTGLSLSAFAAKEDVTPVIIVGGVGTRPYYKIWAKITKSPYSRLR